MANHTIQYRKTVLAGQLIVQLIITLVGFGCIKRKFFNVYYPGFRYGSLQYKDKCIFLHTYKEVPAVSCSGAKFESALGYPTEVLVTNRNRVKEAGLG